MYVISLQAWFLFPTSRESMRFFQVLISGSLKLPWKFKIYQIAPENWPPSQQDVFFFLRLLNSPQPCLLIGGPSQRIRPQPGNHPSLLKVQRPGCDLVTRVGKWSYIPAIKEIHKKQTSSKTKLHPTNSSYIHRHMLHSSKHATNTNNHPGRWRDLRMLIPPAPGILE